jgi:hypothetical protein
MIKKFTFDYNCIEIINHKIKMLLQNQVLSTCKKTRKTRKTWTPQEDQSITNFVENNGYKTISDLNPIIPGVTAKQIRQRYNQKVKPGLIKSSWSLEDDYQLID